MIKKQTLESKIARLDRDITRLETRGGSHQDASRCAATIDWLYKFKLLTPEQLDDFCTRLTRVFEEHLTW